VTFEYGTVLDDSDFKCVRLQMSFPEGKNYVVCKRHKSSSCMCAAAVLAYRKEIGLGEKPDTEE
jgi:hypothetical protein